MKKTRSSKAAGKTGKTGACALRIFAAARFKVFLNYIKFWIQSAVGTIEAIGTIRLTGSNFAKPAPVRA
jgi:hypothetical protein